MKWTSFNVDTRRERVKLIPALLTISLCTTLRMVAFGQVAPVAVNWTGTVRGVGPPLTFWSSWKTTANWAGLPAGVNYPNNGGGRTYAVTIPATNWMPLVDTPIAVNSINLGSNGLRIEEDLDVVDFTVSSGQVQTRFKVDGTRATTTVSDLLVDAPQGGQPGLFSLEDHFLVANQKMQIGSVTGPGRFNQRSDSNARTAFLRIYAGTYWKNEGALIAAQATIGEHPTVQALMDQDGGDATYDELLVGNAAPALAGAGRYDLDDGSVVVRNRMEVTAVGVFDMDGGTLEVKPQALEFVAGQFFQSSGQHKAWELNVSNEYRMTGGSLQVGTELFVYTPFDRQNLAIFNQIFGTVEAVDLAVDRATYTAGPDEPAVLGYTLTVTRDLKLKNGGTLRQFGVDVTATNMIIDAVLLPDTGATR